MKRFIFPFLFLLTLISIYGKAQQNCSLSVQGTVEEVSCSGGMDGAIRLQVSGGTKPYTYYWSNGQEVKDILQLTEGIYTVTVLDKDRCVAKQKFVIKNKKPQSLKINIEQVPVGAGKQKLNLTFGNGMKPYAVTIQNLSEGILSPRLSYNGQALSNGIYSLEAFTEAGCSAIGRVKIEAN